MKALHGLIYALILLSITVAGAALVVHQYTTAAGAVFVMVGLCGLQAAIIAQRGRNRDRNEK